MARTTSATTHRHWSAAAQVAASAVLAAGTFLPWLRSGERGLSVYELHDAARRLDLLDASWIVTPVAFVPLALALGVLARWLGHHLPARVFGLCAAVYTALGAAVVLRGDLPGGVGLVVALVGAALMVVAITAEVVTHRLLCARTGGESLTSRGVDADRTEGRASS